MNVLFLLFVALFFNDDKIKFSFQVQNSISNDKNLLSSKSCNVYVKKCPEQYARSSRIEEWQTSNSYQKNKTNSDSKSKHQHIINITIQYEFYNILPILLLTSYFKIDRHTFFFNKVICQ